MYSVRTRITHIFLVALQLLQDPTLDYMCQCMQAGSVAAYEHIAMIKMHYKITDALDSCVDALESGTRRTQSDRRVLRLRCQPEAADDDSDSDKPATEITTTKNGIENETLSTNSSLNDQDGDEDHGNPAKWEAIRKKT